MWFLLACSDHDGISVKEEDPGYTVGDGLGWRSVSVSAYSGCALDPEGRLHGWGDGHGGAGANCDRAPTGVAYRWVAEGRWSALLVTLDGAQLTARAEGVGPRSRGILIETPSPGPRDLRWGRLNDLWDIHLLLGTTGRAQALLYDGDGLRPSTILPSVPGTPETVTLPGEGGAPPCVHWIDDERAVRSACVDEPYAWPGSGRYVEVVGFADGLCALREDGDTECDLILPLPESPPSGLHGLTAIGTTLCGIQEDGYPWCTDVSGVDAPVAHPPPIPLHSLTGVDWTACGLDDETHIVCWGDNRYGQRDPP